MSHFVNPFSLSACALAASLMITGCGGGSAPTDTTPPTVAITDNVSVATATGAVTFTFAFSEDVGSSFIVEDVTVTGGAAGTLTKVNATQYTLVVTPAANTTGTLSVAVAAAKFKDIALNDNTVGATATQAFSTVVVPTTLATFDEATPPAFVGFDGAEGSSIAAGPSGGTGNALKILRTGGQVWAGAKVTGLTLGVSASNNMFSARVHSPAAGKRIVLKLEGNGDTGDIDAREAVVAGWQTLTWVIPADKIGPVRFDLVFLPDLGTLGTGEAFYIDEVKLGVATTVAPPPPAPVDSILATFDETAPPPFVGFDGAEGTSIAAGPSGGTGNALKILRSGGQVWAGAKITGRTLNVSATANTFSARVHSPAAGKRVVLKLEGNGDTGDIDARETVVAGWQTLTWVIPADKIGPVRSDVVFLPDLGTTGTGEAFYVDDVKLLGGGAVAAPGCTPTAPAASPNLVTFDGDCSILTGFEGTSLAAIVADPAGGSNMVAKVMKPGGNTAAFYAGVTVSNGANFSIPTIPFTATSAKVSLRVYSAYAGMRVRLKLETAGNPGVNVEHDAFTTAANAWETLTFNLVETGTHFIPNGATTYNTALPTANFVLSSTYNKATLFFDFGLGNSGYAAMPAERTYYFDDLKFVP